MRLRGLLCWVRPHRSEVKYTWVTFRYETGSSVTKERPVRYCERCLRVLEVLDA